LRVSQSEEEPRAMEITARTDRSETMVISSSVAVFSAPSDRLQS
jgi:hypothetical protein